jgi:2-polyprenyl-3-methyl-5-hydroxy-6-metoxy-1,4-benzoquinol methylase
VADIEDTRGADYTSRLRRLETARWKSYVPNPYRWWIRRQHLGFVLDVGCGIGRTLEYLHSNGVGVDHNASSIAMCRARGLTCYLPDDFLASPYAVPGRFDSLIMLHVLEHLPATEHAGLLRTYLPYVRPGGRVVLITPQERGFASDPTHVQFVDGDDLARLCEKHGIRVTGWRSFPFPRWAGELWTYNEFAVVGTTSP